MKTLDQYIQENYKSKADFARAMGVFPQAVARWLNNDYYVNDGKMMRVVRDLKQQD